MNNLFSKTFVVLLLVAGLDALPLPSMQAEPAEHDLLLLTGARVFSPEDLGYRDVIVGGSKILGIVDPLSQEDISQLQSLGMRVTVHALNGSVITPGFIDSHCHLTGGGGELGPQSRTPEAKLSELIEAGITTAIGIIGTDSVSRSLPNLLFKVRAINNDGLSAWMFTGGYRVPVPVITTSVMDDLSLIAEVIGVGELAISDHRSSMPTFDELARITSDCRVAGLITGKAGIVHAHVGSATTALKPLWDIIEQTPIPITQFHPTHLSSRGQLLLDDAKLWLKAGGNGDFTADEDDESVTIDALLELQRESIPLTRMTLSTDAYGSIPVFDDEGNVIGYGVGKPHTLLRSVRSLVLEHRWSLAEALKLVTSNVAAIYQLTQKGHVTVGKDADLLVLDSATLTVQYVIARGQTMKTPTWTKKGMFE